MKKLTLPRLASAVLGALFFLAACIVLAVRLVRGEAGLTDAAALVLTACGGAALTVLALRSCAPGLRRSLWVLLAAAAVFLAFAAKTPVLTTVEDFAPGEWTCRILSGVLITVLLICQIRSMATLLRSLNAGVPLRRPRPYRLQRWLARGLVFFWFAWFVLRLLGNGHGTTGGTLNGGWDNYDREYNPKEGTVYVDLADLEGAEETDFWGCYTKVQELCPRMYETTQLSLEPGSEFTRPVLASAETTYYRMLTKGLARKLAEEMTLMRPASMGVSYHDTLEPVETAAGLDGFWWSRKEIGTQHALALLGRQVLLVEYEGETDLRTAGDYFYNLLDGAA